MREAFFNSPDDVAWLFDTHLKVSFKSFILRGNEDAPDELVLYADEEPNVDDKPVAIIKFP